MRRVPSLHNSLITDNHRFMCFLYILCACFYLTTYFRDLSMSIHTVLSQSFFFFLLMFIYLAVLGLSSGMQDLVPDQGSNPGPLHWECGVLTTGPPGKSLHQSFLMAV